MYNLMNTVVATYNDGYEECRVICKYYESKKDALKHLKKKFRKRVKTINEYRFNDKRGTQREVVHVFTDDSGNGAKIIYKEYPQEKNEDGDIFIDYVEEYVVIDDGGCVIFENGKSHFCDKTYKDKAIKE